MNGPVGISMRATNLISIAYVVVSTLPLFEDQGSSLAEIPGVYGISTTYFFAEGLRFIKSTASWIFSRPWPTISGPGLHFNDPFARAEGTQSCQIAGPTCVSLNHAPQSVSFGQQSHPRISVRHTVCELHTTWQLLFVRHKRW